MVDIETTSWTVAALVHESTPLALRTVDHMLRIGGHTCELTNAVRLCSILIRCRGQEMCKLVVSYLGKVVRYGLCDVESASNLNRIYHTARAALERLELDSAGSDDMATRPLLFDSCCPSILDEELRKVSTRIPKITTTVNNTTVLQPWRFPVIPDRESQVVVVSKLTPDSGLVVGQPPEAAKCAHVRNGEEMHPTSMAVDYGEVNRILNSVTLRVPTNGTAVSGQRAKPLKSTTDKELYGTVARSTRAVLATPMAVDDMGLFGLLVAQNGFGVTAVSETQCWDDNLANPYRVDDAWTTRTRDRVYVSTYPATSKPTLSPVWMDQVLLQQCGRVYSQEHACYVELPPCMEPQCRGELDKFSLKRVDGFRPSSWMTEREYRDLAYDGVVPPVRKCVLCLRYQYSMMTVLQWFPRMQWCGATHWSINFPCFNVAQDNRPGVPSTSTVVYPAHAMTPSTVIGDGHVCPRLVKYSPLTLVPTRRICPDQSVHMYFDQSLIWDREHSVCGPRHAQHTFASVPAAPVEVQEHSTTVMDRLIPQGLTERRVNTPTKKRRPVSVSTDTPKKKKKKNKKRHKRTQKSADKENSAKSAVHSVTKTYKTEEGQDEVEKAVAEEEASYDPDAHGIPHICMSTLCSYGGVVCMAAEFATSVTGSTDINMSMTHKILFKCVPQKMRDRKLLELCRAATGDDFAMRLIGRICQEVLVDYVEMPTTAGGWTWDTLLRYFSQEKNTGLLVVVMRTWMVHMLDVHPVLVEPLSRCIDIPALRNCVKHLQDTLQAMTCSHPATCQESLSTTHLCTPSRCTLTQIMEQVDVHIGVTQIPRTSITLLGSVHRRAKLTTDQMNFVSEAVRSCQRECDVLALLLSRPFQIALGVGSQGARALLVIVARYTHRSILCSVSHAKALLCHARRTWPHTMAVFDTVCTFWRSNVGVKLLAITPETMQALHSEADQQQSLALTNSLLVCVQCEAVYTCVQHYIGGHFKPQPAAMLDFSQIPPIAMCRQCVGVTLTTIDLTRCAVVTSKGLVYQMCTQCQVRFVDDTIWFEASPLVLCLQCRDAAAH
jgi:hypothetical protein